MNAVCTESSCFYTGAKGTFPSSSCTLGLAFGSVTAFKDVTVIVEALLDALVQQPVSVAIEADRVFLQLYSGAVTVAPMAARTTGRWRSLGASPVISSWRGARVVLKSAVFSRIQW